MNSLNCFVDKYLWGKHFLLSKSLIYSGNGEEGMASNVDGNGFGSNWDDKLRLLDAIDSMREPVRSAPAAAAVAEKTPVASDTFEALQEKLRVYEQTCAMLEREVQILEQQTFASLAEASRLRRELDLSKADRSHASGQAEYIEKEQFNRIIKESENERRLLLDALESSEAELARMVKTLDTVVRRLQVA
jgi:hypothetical protein